ncbi:hypothetical protein D3C75_1113420 [compost metagenome]
MTDLCFPCANYILKAGVFNDIDDRLANRASWFETEKPLMHWTDVSQDGVTIYNCNAFVGIRDEVLKDVESNIHGADEIQQGVVSKLVMDDHRCQIRVPQTPRDALVLVSQ